MSERCQARRPDISNNSLVAVPDRPHLDQRRAPVGPLTSQFVTIEDMRRRRATRAIFLVMRIREEAPLGPAGCPVARAPWRVWLGQPLRILDEETDRMPPAWLTKPASPSLNTPPSSAASQPAVAVRGGDHGDEESNVRRPGVGSEEDDWLTARRLRGHSTRCWEAKGSGPGRVQLPRSWLMC